MPDPVLPRRLGRYAIEGRIERGAMGHLLYGRDTASGVAVAVKVLVPAAGDPTAVDELRQRFVRESLVLRRLAHPGIVRFLDAGEDFGLAWLAMELAPGHDLGRHVAAGALLLPRSVVDIGSQLAAALAHAHRQGVVHRDLKPSNVIYDATTGITRLTDFGIARLANAGSTRTGVVLGTLSYMAPEQLAGGPVDERTDLYALGVTLFQLLTGRLPHEADSMGELMRRIAQQPAPGLRDLRPDLPEALAALVAGLLDKAPARRPADGRLVAAALRDIADRLPGDPAP